MRKLTSQLMFLVPKYYKGKPFRIDHQENALDKWVKHDYKGILEHATGSERQ